jgi:hemerythrin
MDLVRWNESLSVKVTEIDRQHQKLVSMINELGEAMRQGKGKDALSKIINGLVSYTVTHFKTEEKYFDQFGYPKRDSHKKEHAEFVKKVSDFKDGFENGSITLTIEIMYYLSDWVQKHIKGSDKLYTNLFIENGLK